MADYKDRAVIDLEEASATLYEDICQDSVSRIRTQASKIEAGEAGSCEICDEESLRLVSKWYINGKVMSCARCRDALKLG